MARTKGDKGIPHRKKALILAQKNARLCTSSEIAAKEGVSVRSVHNISNESVSADVLQMSRKYEQELITYAQANALKAVKRVYETIDELPADKAVVVAEKSFNMVQIYRNKPTQIVQLSDEDNAVALVRFLMEERPDIPADEIIKFVETDQYPNVPLRKLLGSGK